MRAARSTPSTYETILAVFQARTGMVISPIRRAEAEAGIRRAMAKMNASNPSEFHNLLLANGCALDALAIELTVGETYFFREAGQFDFLRQRILPDLRSKRSVDGTMRLWSAGCATGEEAYSLAILLEQEGLAGQADILATDISRASLATARTAIYEAWSLRQDDGALPTTMPYFRKSGRRFALAERFREHVKFEYLNLAVDTYPSLTTGTVARDLIFCRNVLIYFDAATVKKVAARLFRSLAPGGWLVTGPSDPPLWDHAPFEIVATPAGVFYQRSRTRLHRDATKTASAVLPKSQPMPPSAAIVPRPKNNPCENSRTRHPAPADPSTSTSARLSEAQEALEHGDPGRALDLLQRLPSHPEVCVLQIRALANLGDVAEAAEKAAAAAASHPFCAELRYLQAVLLFGLRRYKEAAATMRQVIYIDRSLAVAHLTLGAILRQCGALEGARRAYRNAYDLCAMRPAEEPVPLSDGVRAGRLADTAKAQLALLDTDTDGDL